MVSNTVIFIFTPKLGGRVTLQFDEHFFWNEWLNHQIVCKRFLYRCVYLEDREVGSQIYILMPGLQSSTDLSNVIRHTGLQLFNKMLTNWNEWNHLEKLQIRYPNLEKFRGRQDFPAPKRRPRYLHEGNWNQACCFPKFSLSNVSPGPRCSIAVLIVKVKLSPGEQIQVKQREGPSVTFPSFDPFFCDNSIFANTESEASQKTSWLTGVDTLLLNTRAQDVNAVPWSYGMVMQRHPWRMTKKIIFVGVRVTAWKGQLAMNCWPDSSLLYPSEQSV